MSVSPTNTTALALRALHKPGNPLILSNIYDAITAKIIAALPSTHALATASWSIAAAANIDDNSLDFETNLRAIRAIAPIAQEFGKPLTVDFQDGYGDTLEEGIQQLIKLGVVGINLEDTNNAKSELYSVTEASARIKRVISTASSLGVPDFVVNARTDTLVHGNTLQDAILRGHAYLDAGATNIFVWGGSARGELRKAEVEQLVEALQGKLNVMVSLSEGGLKVSELSEIGVARCSVGPGLQFPAMKAFADAAVRYSQS